ncbi:crotonobetainyl-CoA:carnitine CoA-transferase CaiB-like acyl-CoA transferase [Amycolatopsis bartoniae]|uniref:CoA transferase n=1 Tax=Amycolatopsis bartoniae TaxID=941986 RepID=A0A8H9MBL7_9PSEU|nr:CoA transferase [Amycolatopsis bartoniae]MBB2939705.1 crotonobetainyl-CoA:carnitine CoA-transferase CaiB-like acyl-CoA transferase [Amycolatopsis bartoniae]GHF36374.1 CoA transferase [Amycolatopsis bartoniae]
MTDNTPSYDPPLLGVQVVDLVSGPMQAVGRHLLDLGASVHRVRLSGVTSDAGFGPVVDGVALGSVLATRGATESALTPDSQSWQDLLAGADLLIENTAPGSAAESRLDVEAIRRAHPSLVILSISDFGRGNAFSTWQATSPVFHALTSELSRSGLPGRPPLIPPAELPYDVAAAQAVFQLLSLYLDRLRTGAGNRIDFSVLDGAMQTLDPAYGMAGSAAAGVPPSQAPRGRTDERYRYPIIPCKDGFARICILAKRQWRGMFEWLGRPEEFADAKYDNLMVRFSSPTLLPAIARLFADKTRAELEQQGQEHGVPTAAVLTLDEALQTEQIKARAFLRDVELAPGVTRPVPAGVVEIDGARAWADNVPAAPAPSRTVERTGGRPSGLPLSGLRILDLGVIVVGGDTGRLFGDLGADVIKVENSAFPDGARAAQGATGMAAGFASGHRNKRSIGINLRDPEGHRLVRELARSADIVLTNFKPGVINSLGLDYASLQDVNPGLVVVDSSAFGPTGPWARRLGYGPLVRAAAGCTDQWVYPGEPGSFSDAVTVYPDHVCARVGAFAALALLIRRRRTGRGGSVSVAQSEVMLSHFATKIAAGARADRPEHDAPWGLFPAAGDDEWVAVTIRGNADWNALCSVIDRPDLSADPSLADAAGRDAQRDRVDGAVAAWTALHSPADAMAALQAAGVPAGAMLRGIDLPEWDYYRARRSFRDEPHPLSPEPYVLENVQIHADGITDPPLRPAPLLGEQTYEIARELLDLDTTQVDDFVRRGVLEANTARVEPASGGVTADAG